MTKKIIYFLSLCCIALFYACSQTSRLPLSHTGNAIYYWRTSFMLDSVEQAFLNKHHIQRIYCRYFDVVMNEQQGPTPNATIVFAQNIADSIEIIPTIFIMNDCMQQYDDSLAQRIVKRILQMNESNDIHHVREIQIDCDYTARNRNVYYQFLDKMKQVTQTHNIELSTTIRLHQLSMPAPPVSYGILMLYNTGAPEQFAERNPILDLRDVKPYLHYLKDYPLPIGAAYPTFAWHRQIHGVNIVHTADIDEIMRTKRLVEAERSDLRELILTYHLDNENINRYKSEQYEEIYRH